jgi:hypothetical protein
MMQRFAAPKLLGERLADPDAPASAASIGRLGANKSLKATPPAKSPPIFSNSRRLAGSPEYDAGPKSLSMDGSLKWAFSCREPTACHLH